MDRAALLVVALPLAAFIALQAVGFFAAAAGLGLGVFAMIALGPLIVSS